MRIWLSRELGVLAMGLVELAQSAQMLLITPVVSGLPAAISRMCAKEDAEGSRRVLRIGAAFSLAVSLPLAAAAFALRGPIALWLGDLRTLPALILYLPCLPVLGLSCALNGYYYGVGKPMLPALSELLEQIIRVFLTMQLVSLLSAWPLPLRTASPALGALIGETAGLALMLFCAAKALRKAPPSRRDPRSMRATLGELLSLSLPLTGMRMVTSLMRTVSSTLLPRRLMHSGLSSSQALSQLGVMQGMMMPILMLPSFITCSLTSVAAPELARRQAKNRSLDGIILRSVGASLVIGTAAMAGVWLLAPVIAGTLYRQPELLPMLRRSCALIPVMAMAQVAGGLMHGLGLQSASLRIALWSNFLSVLLMYILPAKPTLRIRGAILAVGASHVMTLMLSLRALKKEIRKGCISR